MCGVSRKVQFFLLWKITFQSKALCSQNMGKWMSPCLSSHLPKVHGNISQWLNCISASNCPSHRNSIKLSLHSALSSWSLIHLRHRKKAESDSEQYKNNSWKYLLLGRMWISEKTGHGILSVKTKQDRGLEIISRPRWKIYLPCRLVET